VNHSVWSQPEPILDLALVDGDSQLLILNTGKVAAYRMTDGKWSLSAQAFLSLARPTARDPRGRLEINADSLRAFVPGTTCTGALTPSVRFTCAPGSDSWPLNPREAGLEVHWVTDRNTLESAGVSGTFFNAGGDVFATSDNQIKDRANATMPGAEKWGSDLARIENPCGPNPLVIASAAGEALGGDQVQVFEIANGQAGAASEPLALPGAVTTLWPAETAGQVTLVVRNSKTGNYEASRLGLACTQ
jgi:hypothetical protein